MKVAIRKNVREEVASAVHTDPGKEGFKGDNGQPGPACLRPAGGRADSMCYERAAARGSSYAACSHA